MASGEFGKRIERLQAASQEARGVQEGLFDVSAGEIGAQQGQLRQDFLRQQGQTEQGFNPFIQAGQQALGQVQQGATGAGFNQRLQDIIGGGTFQSLRDEQERAARGQFAAAGLTGSGGAIQDVSQISPTLALQLENQLFGRQQGLASQGFQGVQQRGALGNQLTLGQGGLASGLTGLLTGQRQGLGRDIASGITGTASQADAISATQQQAKAARQSQLLSLAGTAFGAVAGGPIGASLANRFIGGGGGGSPIPGSSGPNIGFGLRNSQGNFF